MATAPHAERSLPAFFGLLLVLSLPFWALGWVAGEVALLPAGLPIAALQFVVPGIAAALLVRRRGGARSLRAFLARVGDVRRIRGAGWWLTVILLMPAAILAAYAVMRLLGLPNADPAASISGVASVLVLYLVAAAFEELGWTGYALGPLRARFGVLGAGLLLGGVWGVWHLVPLLQDGHGAAWLAWWFLGTVALRVVMTWLSEHTGGSVFAATVVHALSNLPLSTFPNYDAGHFLAVIAAVTMAMAVLVMVLAPARPLSSLPQDQVGGVR